MQTTASSKSALTIAMLTGVLLGTVVFLGAKLTNPPPLDWMDVEFYEHLGQPLSAFALETLDGQRVSSTSMAGQPYAIVLVSTGCGACDPIYPLLKEPPPGATVILAGSGERSALAAKVDSLELQSPAVYDSLAVVMRGLGNPGFPSAVLVGADGNIIKAGGGTLGTRKILEMAAALGD